jgi:dienelactone hydrolase
MGKGLILFALGWALVLGGGWLAHKVQTAGGIAVTDVRFSGPQGETMSALLYVPASATAAQPAPGVLAVHGYINTRETQDGFAIEFARRGYVVLALDQTGHGYSDPPAFSNGFGGPAGLAYLRALPMVDKANIGLEGHSMGGWTVLAAAKAAPDAYRALVLEGSSTGAPFAADGDAAWPRNLAVVFSQYDEFAKLMWGVDRAKDVAASAKLATLFGTTAPVAANRLYGSVDLGTARILKTPPVTHPGDHISRTAIGDATDWFSRTLRGGAPKVASDQTWPWKEVGTLIAFVGFVSLLLGTFDLLLRTPPFAALRAAPAPARTARDGRWWATLIAGALIPAITYFPFMALGGLLLPPSAIFRQTVTSQIMFWALLNAAIVLLLGLLLKAPRPATAPRPGLGLVIAVVTVAVGFLAVWVSDVLFKTDLRFFVLALKLPAAHQWIAFLIYLAPLTGFFAVTLGALHRNLAVAGEGAARSYLSAIAALALGFAVLLALDYGWLFATGALLTPWDPLDTVIAMQFLPLMTIVAVISAFAWRRTGSALPGALICGLFVTWYITAGTATHWADGMPFWPGL